jgi:hypothetical protein
VVCAYPRRSHRRRLIHAAVEGWYQADVGCN